MKTLKSLINEYTIFGPLNEDLRYTGPIEDDSALEMPPPEEGALDEPMAPGGPAPAVDLSNPEEVVRKFMQWLELNSGQPTEEEPEMVDPETECQCEPGTECICGAADETGGEIEEVDPDAEVEPEIEPQGDLEGAPAGDELEADPGEEDEIDFDFK